ncbi:unnamed protein product [Phytophthora fragariaefolia]|uniref:Unnamed protein product n=1 Tax=Phytophthora fragariaefolia TaxID=1490495 RepID=A0A9W6WVV0_9STRA|nr:unnamed protein product [Phytophthora fragariaefolia]
MSTTLLSVFTFFLFTAASTSATNNVSVSPTPRRLQTYTQPSDYVGLMLERVNLERAAQGLPALCTNSKLQAAAQRHSDDQAANDFMDHTGSDDSSMSQRVTDAGYDWRGVAENVAAGQVDVAEVMDAWMNSEGHRRNILGDYTMLGAAYAYTPDGMYRHFWTQDFGRSDTEQCDGSAPASRPSDGTSPFSNSSDDTTASSSRSNDGTMPAPNGRDSRGTSSSCPSTSPPSLPALLLLLLTSTSLLHVHVQH